MTHTTILLRPATPRAVWLTRTVALARTAAPLLLVALAACGDDGPTGSSAPNRVSFAYTASGPVESVEGTYHAEGDPTLTVPPITQTYALGRRDSGEGLLEVISNVAYPTLQEADFVVITIPRLTVGSVAIDGICPGEDCAAVSLGLELSTDVAVSQARYSCALNSGTIRITSISNDRAKGTFSGTGSCLAAPGYEDLDEFSITGGTFDVKVKDTLG